MMTPAQQKIAERIAARKALGMTADEFNAHLKKQEQEQKQQRVLAVRDCLLSGIKGDEKAIDAALERYKAAGGKLNVE